MPPTKANNVSFLRLREYSNDITVHGVRKIDSRRGIVE